VPSAACRSGVDCIDPFEAGRVSPTFLDPGSEHAALPGTSVLQQHKFAPRFVDAEHAPTGRIPIESFYESAELAQPADSPRDRGVRCPVRRHVHEASEAEPIAKGAQELPVVAPEVDPEMRVPLRGGPKVGLSRSKAGEEGQEAVVGYGNR
jgi:hypothetical protein